MGKNIKRALFGALLGIGTTYSLAAVAGGVWSSYGNITELKQYGTGFAIEGLTLPDPASCGSTSVGAIYTGLDATYIDRMERLVLAAFLSGRKVSVKVSDAACEGSSPAIYAVQVLAQP